jgi:hypothetical protein
VEIARLVREQTRPDDPILVWGPHPELYVLAERSAGTRYVGLMSIVGPNVEHAGRSAIPGALEELLRDLEACPPAMIVLAPEMANYDLGQSHLRSLRAWIEASYADSVRSGSTVLLRHRHPPVEGP